MKTTLTDTIKTLGFAVEEWLSPGNFELRQAIDKTVNQGLFSIEDIKFQLLTLKKSLSAGEIHRWAEKAGLHGWKPTDKKVLCLHAGNLPLVGVQDILAVVLSGYSYLGKLSRKDPYLPATLLDLLQKRGLVRGKWTTDLEDMHTERSSAVMFSGSTESAGPVVDRLEKMGIISSQTPHLIRTAHYSMAFIEDETPETMRHLTDAVFRYGGSGCRSVALVVAPFSLADSKCHFTDYAEEFWLRNPQHKKPSPSLYHRFAYNRSVGIEQSWLDHFLIEETGHKPSEPFVLHWVCGNRDTFIELARKFQDGLQALYSSNPDLDIPGDLPQAEWLSDAQKPPIWWEPDGTDPLRWLIQIRALATG